MGGCHSSFVLEIKAAEIVGGGELLSILFRRLSFRLRKLSSIADYGADMTLRFPRQSALLIPFPESAILTAQLR